MLAGAVALLALCACKERECADCLEGAVAVRCYIGFSYQDVCGVDLTTAAANCLEAGGGSYVSIDVCTEVADGETGNGADGGQSWDPSLTVQYDRETGEYVLDRDTLERLESDPSPSSRPR